MTLRIRLSGLTVHLLTHTEQLMLHSMISKRSKLLVDIMAIDFAPERPLKKSQFPPNQTPAIHRNGMCSPILAPCAPGRNRCRATIYKSTPPYLDLSSEPCKTTPVPTFFHWQAIQRQSVTSSVPRQHHLKLSKVRHRKYLRPFNDKKRRPSNPHCG